MKTTNLTPSPDLLITNKFGLFYKLLANPCTVTIFWVHFAFTNRSEKRFKTFFIVNIFFKNSVIMF